MREKREYNIKNATTVIHLSRCSPCCSVNWVMFIRPLIKRLCEVGLPALAAQFNVWAPFRPPYLLNPLMTTCVQMCSKSMEFARPSTKRVKIITMNRYMTSSAPTLSYRWLEGWPGLSRSRISPRCLSAGFGSCRTIWWYTWISSKRKSNNTEKTSIRQTSGTLLIFTWKECRRPRYWYYFDAVLSCNKMRHFQMLYGKFSLEI